MNNENILEHLYDRYTNDKMYEKENKQLLICYGSQIINLSNISFISKVNKCPPVYNSSSYYIYGYFSDDKCYAHWLFSSENSRDKVFEKMKSILHSHTYFYEVFDEPETLEPEVPQKIVPDITNLNDR